MNEIAIYKLGEYNIPMVGLQLIILLAQQVALGYAELYEMTLISLYLKIG